MRDVPLRIGLVGTGWVANQHAAGYRMAARDEIRVVAACDPDPSRLESFCRQWEIPRKYASAGQMISDGDLDALVLLTPPAVRDEVIEPALGHGLHLLIEKPFATGGAAALRYTEAAERAGITMAVSQNFRWFPEYQWLARRLEAPEAGEVRFLHAHSFQDRPQSADVWRGRESKLEMAIYSIHLIDRLQWLSGSSPAAVTAHTRRGPDPRVPGEQFTTLTVECADGVLAQMTSSWLSRGIPYQQMRVDTTEGSALVERTSPMQGEARGCAQFGAGREDETFSETQEAPHGPLSYGHSAREFARAVREQRDPSHSARNNLRTMGIMEAAYLSAQRDGSPVTVDEGLTT